MTSSDDKAAEHKGRGIPPEMESGEAKGLPNDKRLESEVAHGRPDEDDATSGGKRGPERRPTGEGA